jgi:ankyrin repeat protein
MGAAEDGHLEAVELLLDKGAAINAVNKDGMTALGMAEKHGRADVARYLKLLGANQDGIRKHFE